MVELPRRGRDCGDRVAAVVAHPSAATVEEDAIGKTSYGISFLDRTASSALFRLLKLVSDPPATRTMRFCSMVAV